MTAKRWNIINDLDKQTTIKFLLAQKRFTKALQNLEMEHLQGDIGDRAYLEGLWYITGRLKVCNEMRNSTKVLSTHCHCPECSGILTVVRDGRPGSGNVDVCKCTGCGRECDHCGARQR